MVAITTAETARMPSVHCVIITDEKHTQSVAFYIGLIPPCLIFNILDVRGHGGPGADE